MKNHIEIWKFNENEDVTNIEISINDYLQHNEYNPISVSCSHEKGELIICIVVETLDGV